MKQKCKKEALTDNNSNKSTDGANKVVSMSCRRHRRRINVRESWINTCSYLCPQCYERLTEAERLSYAPNKNGFKAEVRPMEQGKPIVEPTKSYKLPKEQKPTEGLVKEETNRTSPKEKSSFSGEFKGGYSLKDLLPKYTVTCKKCGETVPCHYEWYNNSTVLCPTCFSMMSSEEIELFHMEHCSDRPPIKKESSKNLIYGNQKDGKIRKTEKEYALYDKQSIYLHVGGRWSDKHIKHANKESLMAAVKRGLVSPIRAKIELRRRANREWFDSMPEVYHERPRVY